MEESQIRVCNFCKLPKHRKDFSNSRTRKNGFSYRCKKCDKLYRNSSSAKARYNELKRAKHFKHKVLVLQHFGGSPPKCACCSETKLEFLAIDHMNRDGAKHRRELGISGGYKFYAWLIKHGYPDGFRVLCHNCNMAIGVYGYCPHTEEGLSTTSREIQPRHRRGSSNPMAKLTEFQVQHIKEQLALGVTQKKIARQFNVGRGAIEHIAAGNTWRHI